jgi:Ca-activated chloride channel family protein
MHSTKPRATLVACLALSFALAGKGQPEPAVEARPVTNIRVDVNVVNILCTARRSGRYVMDLGKDDFTILEDGKPQKIRYFARDADTPLTVALMLDVSGSVTRILDTEKEAASSFCIEVLRPMDKALLVTFSHIIAVIQETTSNVRDMRSGLRKVRQFDYNLPAVYQPHGGTLLYEAVKRICEERLAGLTGRKVMVIVTDGLDNGSRVSAEDAIKAAQQADTVIYGIHYAAESSEAEQGERALDRLSEPTGGRNFNVNFVRTVESIFDTIREEMRSEYSIGYVSTNQAKDGRYRRITLKTTRSGVKLQARQGYYAPIR